MINFFLGYLAYLLGLSLFVLDIIAKYKQLADAHPNPSVVFNGKIFWNKEWVNIIRMLLLGVVSLILMIPLGSITIDFSNVQGQSMFSTSAKVLSIPLYIVFGWTGGKATLGLLGKYKKELQNKTGFEDKD